MSLDSFTIPQIVMKCQAHKRLNVRFAKAIWEFYPNDKLASHIYSCSSQISTMGEAIVASSFCRERLCPVCQWRKAQKLSYQNNLVLDELQSDYRFVFLTLTCRSCSLADLRDTVLNMFEAYKKLYRRTWFKRFGIRGFIKSLEITYNPDTCLFHPHLHNILVCDKGSWLPDQKFFVGEWSACLGCDYSAVVDIRVARNLHEVSKYIVKSEDFLKGFYFAAIHDLNAAIKGLRFCSFGGVVKDVRKRLCLTDPEDSSLEDGLTVDAPVLDWSFDFSSLHYGIH